jgi:hypothetical protein
VVMMMTQHLEWRRRILSRMYCKTRRNQFFFRGYNTTEGRKEGRRGGDKKKISNSAAAATVRICCRTSRHILLCWRA